MEMGRGRNLALVDTIPLAKDLDEIIEDERDLRQTRFSVQG